MKKSVVIVAVSLLTTVVSLTHYYEPRNMSGMEYWHELHKELYESIRDGADKADAQKRYSRVFTNSMEGLEWLKRHSGCVNSISVTSKGLTVRYDASVADSDLPIKLTVETFNTDARYTMRDWEMGGVGRGLALGEELSLPLDKKTILRRDDVRAIFTPVMFKNGKKGFRISVVAGTDLYVLDGRVSHTLYVALSDKPVQVGEEDVDKAILITTESSDGISFLKRFYFDPVSVTPTSLSLWFKPHHPQDFVVELEGVKRLSAEYKANNEPLVLFAGQSARLVDERTDSVTTVTFTPVLFKSHRKFFWGAIPLKPLDGFRVVANANSRFSDSNTVTDTRYIVLSDTHILMGEAELVEKSEASSKGRAQVSPSSRNKVKKGKATTGDEPSEEDSKASHFWLYVILFHLILFPTLYFMRRKRVRSVLHRRGDD